MLRLFNGGINAGADKAKYRYYCLLKILTHMYEFIAMGI